MLLVFGAASVYGSLSYLNYVKDSLTQRAKGFIAGDMRLSGQSLGFDTQSISAKANQYGLTSCISYELPTNIMYEGTYHTVRLKSLQSCYPFYGELEPSTASSIQDFTLLADESSEFVSNKSILLDGKQFILSGYISKRSDTFAFQFSVFKNIYISHTDLKKLSLINPYSRIKKIIYLKGETDDIQRFNDAFISESKKHNVTVEVAHDLNTLKIDALLTIHRVVAIFTIIIGVLSFLFFIITMRPLIAMEQRYHNALYDHGITEPSLLFIIIKRILVTLSVILIPLALVYPQPESLVTLFCIIFTVSLWLRIPLFNDAIWIKSITYLFGLLSAYLLTSILGFGFSYYSYLMTVGTILLIAAAIYLYHHAVCISLIKIPQLPKGIYYGLMNIRSIPHTSYTTIALIIVMVSLSLTLLIKDSIESELKLIGGSEAPNHFVIGIAEDKKNEFVQQFSPITQSKMNLSPLYRAKLVQINDINIADIDVKSFNAKRFLNREYNLTTQLDTPGTVVEEGFAKRLGLKLGDTLTFNLYGEKVRVAIDKIVKIQWSSLQPNFFVSINRSHLKDFPHSYITSFYISPGSKKAFNVALKNFPSTTQFDMNEIITVASDLLQTGTNAVLFLAFFILFLTIIALIAINSSNQQLRMKTAQMLYQHGITYKQQQRFGTNEQITFAFISIIASIPLSLYSFYQIAHFLQLPVNEFSINRFVIIGGSHLTIFILLFITTRMRLKPATDLL